MSGTSLSGTFKDCGPGKLPQLDFVCAGPSCGPLNQFPDGSATDSGSDLEYNSNARCDSDNSNYASQYVFSQPQPEIDHYVSQEQNITLPDCKGLHVQSDGTSAGTHVDALERTSESGCEEPQPSPSVVPPPSQSPGHASSGVPLPGSSTRGVGSASSTPQANPTSYQPPQVTVSAAHHHHPKTGVLLLFLLVLGFFIQGTSAHPEADLDTEGRITYKLQIRALSDNLRVFAQHLGGYVATKVNEEEGDGQVFADKLISDTLSTICQNFFSGGAPQPFSPVVLDNCITAVYDDSSAVKPDLEFLAVFGASMFCNYLTSQAYPIADQFSSEACQGLEDLIVQPSGSPTSTQVQTPPPAPSSEQSQESSVTPPVISSEATPSSPTTPTETPEPSTTSPSATSATESSPECTSTAQMTCDGNCVDVGSDSNNCGACGVVCSSGVCSNGACSLNSCTGQTCDTFTECGPGGSCVCASIVDNTGFCVSGVTPCPGLADCTTSADCPLGAVCAVNTCCDRNVCIVADTCGGFTNSTTNSLFIRGGAGDTIAHRAIWDV